VIDLDLATMASLLREGKGAFKDARSNGLRAELLTGDGLKIFNFVSDYYLRFGDLPPLPIIAGKTGINLEDPPAGVPSAFLVSEVLDRALHSKLLKGWNKLDELLRATPTDAKGSLTYLEEFLLELRREKLSEAKVQSLFTLGPEVVAYYQMMEQGKMGIQTPWAGVNEPTMGFWPMDLILFVARVGIGKTWTTVITALHAWQQGKRVLFASTEISRLRIATRMYALLHRLPYRQFISGKLDVFTRDKFFKGVEDLLGQESLYAVGGDFDFRVEPRKLS